MSALLESRKTDTVLIGDIQSFAVKRAMEDTSRRQDIIHPSEMAKENWCPRSTGYRISGVEASNPAPVHGHRMLTIFQEGHDIHSKWQTWLAEMGRIWGRWECRICGHSVFDVAIPSCDTCNQPMDYREVPLDASGTYLIAGHADGAVPDLKAFIEIKSIGLGTLRMEEPQLVSANTVKTEDGRRIPDYDAIWKGLKRPLKTHRRQALIYLALARHLGWDYDRMIFIYENKANQETKEFVIQYSEEAVQPLLEVALDIKRAVDYGSVLPRPAGFAQDSAPCKDCVYKNYCWGIKENDEFKQDRQSDTDTATQSRVPRSQAETRPAADLHAVATAGRVPRSAR